MFRAGQNKQLLFALAAVVAATVIICVCAAVCSGGKLTFKKTFYFVCYRQSDNAASAGALSDAASGYGGAGYIIEYGGNYYVTLSCYYDGGEAETVCSNLKKRDWDCSVLEIETDKYPLRRRGDKELFLGNLNTLCSLSSIAYDCANKLDTGEYNQSAAKSVMSSIISTLNGLIEANKNNNFSRTLEGALKDCETAEKGYILSKDMRYIQIAFADIIINAELN